MRRRCLWLSPVLLAFWLALMPGLEGRAGAAGPVRVERWVETTVADFGRGSLEGVEVSAVGDGELRLAGGQGRGTYTSAEQEMPFPCPAASLLYLGRVPASAALSFELRGQDASGQWSPWVLLPPPGPWTDPQNRSVSEALLVFPQGQQRLQYRATFYRGKDSPALEQVVVVCLAAEGGPAVPAQPPWKEADGRPRPLPPEKWGAEAASEAIAETTIPARVEVRPATWLVSGTVEAAPSLRMVQHFQRELLGRDDLAYAFLVDSGGGIYQGRRTLTGDTLYIGLLGVHPHEPASPTVEDALVALLTWWQEQLPAEQRNFTLTTPYDPALAERLKARLEAANLRRSEWLLPRGITAPDTDEWVLLTNPEPRRIQATMELFLDGGRTIRRTVRLPAEARGSLLADQVVAQAGFWARLRADGDLLVERAIYYGHDGDDSHGLESLSRSWYLPGGTQEGDATTTLTLLNPGDAPATATVRIFAPTGPAGERAYPLPPRSRWVVSVGEVYTGTTPLGCQVSSTLPIAAEQEVRFSAGEGGYGMPGSPYLSRRWSFAAVETESPYVTVLAILNPHTATVPLTLTLMSEDGTMLRRTYGVRPGEQRLNLNTILPELALAAEAEAGRPLAIARITFFNEMRSAHATLGATRPARIWYLPEGSTAEPFETFVLAANPNPVPTDLELTFLGSQGTLDRLRLSIPAYGRLTVPLNEFLPDVAAFSTRVISDWPVVVERNMYWHDQEGGHACLGIPR
ncbi:MAG: DUF5719 family protein [Chloroflexia bacterium]